MTPAYAPDDLNAPLFDIPRSPSQPLDQRLADIVAADTHEPPPDAPLRKSVLRRVLTRDIPKPPFAGKKLGRAEVERLLAVAADGGRPGALDLRGADLREADLTRLNLAGVKLGDDDPLATDEERNELAARLDRAQLAATNLEGAIANGVSFEGANLRAVRLTGANLMYARLSGAFLAEAQMSGARLTEANLTEATLTEANLAGAVLVGATLSHARMRGAHLEGADLGLANLEGADLRHTYCDDQTYFGGVRLREASLDGMRFRDTDLTAIDWGVVRRLGEEIEANQALPAARAPAYRVAARAYRRLGVALRAQGMTPEGHRFAARARQMEERALWAETRDRWRGRRYLPTLVSAIRWLATASQGAVTAFGQRPLLALGWGAITWVIFACILSFLTAEHPDIGTALILSGGALVGRGYVSVPDLALAPGLPAFLSVIEALIGTLLELLGAITLARKTLG